MYFESVYHLLNALPDLLLNHLAIYQIQLDWYIQYIHRECLLSTDDSAVSQLTSVASTVEF